MITKRSIITETILVICLLCACIYGFLWMKRQVKPNVSSTIFCVVPPDAIGVQRFRSFEGLWESYASDKALLSLFCTSDNGLSRFVHEVVNTRDGGSLLRSEVVLSVHYTGKNNLQVLLGVNRVQFLEEEEPFLKFCGAFGATTLFKSYNNVEIYQLFTSPNVLYISVVDGFLLASTSSVVVESSIRHLKSGRSLLNDNQVFESLATLSASTSESSVYINVRQIDKLFGSLLSKQMQPYADFFSKSASWISLDGTTVGNLIQMSGYFLVDKGDADYFSTFINQVPAPVKIWEAVPSSTIVFLSFTLSNFEQYRSQYDNYLEIHKKNKNATARVKAWEAQTNYNLNEWFVSLSPVEVALARIPVNEAYRWITIVRSNHAQQAKNYLGFTTQDAKLPPQVLPNQTVGAFSALFGSLFDINSESHYTFIDNLLFIGPQEALEMLIAGYDKTPSLYTAMRQGRLKGQWKEESSLTCVFQASAAKDSLLSWLDPRYVPLVKEALVPYHQAITLFQLTALGGRPNVHLAFYADATKTENLSSGSHFKGVVDTEPTPMVTGSFKIFNHASRKNEEIVQMPDSTLVLKDAAGRETWRTHRKYAIIDQLKQIDYLKNDKLQMLFVSGGTELCLLDILGRLTPPYPVKMTIPVRRGPFVFDIDSKKDYLIFLIHTDNSLRLYDRSGVPMPDWNVFIPDDRIEQEPVLLSYAQGRYWLVYGDQKDYILKPDGTITVALQRGNRIKRDSEVSIDETGVLNAVSIEERILTVQLNTGTINTRKP